MLAAAALPQALKPACPNCECTVENAFNRCPFGHMYCDNCSIVIAVNPVDMLPSEFTNFCPQCKTLSDASPKRDDPQPPSAFFCPINHTVMRDPVVIQDGMSYERGAITEWLEKNDTSPLTSATVDREIILANVNLRNIITLWLDGHGKQHEDFD